MKIITAHARLGCALLALLGFASPAAAERLKLVVSGASFRPFPVGAPAAVSSDGDVSTKALRELTRALHGGVELVRGLELLPPKSYVAPADEPWTKPNYKNWVNVGASGLIRLAASPQGDKLEVGCRFYDVVAQRELLYKTFTVPSASPDVGAHQCVDAVVKQLTGEEGILSSRVVYIKKTKGGKAVFMSDLFGGNIRRLTPADQLSLLPSWDPTGKFVMFTSYLKENPDLYRLNLQTEKLEWLSKKRGLNTGAAVSPDGKKIALTLSVDGNTEIYVMDWDGNNLKRLTDSWGQDVSATWSPDGKRIAFVSSRSGQPHIYLMNADGTNQRRLTFQGNYNQEPNWSPRPDGQIAFTARDEHLMYDIFLVHPDTGEITRLTQDEGQRNESPSFSPDGQHILFTSNRAPGKGRKLYIMDVDGRNQRRISKIGGDVETPRWGPRAGW